MSSNDPKYVANVNKLLYDLALQACRKQVLVFSSELKKNMLSMGVSKKKTAEIIKEAFKGYTTMDVFKKECAHVMNDVLEAYLRPSERNRDILGRLLLEFGVIRAYKRQVVFPDGSKQDDQARKEFVKGVFARPLLRYFLVSVRGTLPEVDEFEAKPVLFGLENEAMAERREDLAEIVKEFTTHYKYGKHSTNWQELYEDVRCKQIAYETLAEILESMESLGSARYLKILNNIQNNNKFAEERMRMDRLFETNDVKQLMAALGRGHTKLAEELGPLS